MQHTLASFSPGGPPPSSGFAAIESDEPDWRDEAPAEALIRQLARVEEESGIDERSLGLFEEIGRASWYGEWHHGRTTASGAAFDMNALTAAHRTLPLGTNVRVTNLDNGRSIDVTINDRGPYVGRRVIDLSREAARELRMERAGLASVLIEELPPEDPTPAPTKSASAN